MSLVYQKKVLVTYTFSNCTGGNQLAYRQSRVTIICVESRKDSLLRPTREVSLRLFIAKQWHALPPSFTHATCTRHEYLIVYLTYGLHQ